MSLLLPPGFMWGWATAATEVEGGGLDNVWTRWLERNAERLARQARGRSGSVPVWDLVGKAATDPGNYRYGNADGHWDRYDEDYRLAGSLGFGAGQITVDWSRVETSPGHYDEDALSHYRDMVTSMRAHGQEPFVQLWHFADPLWLRDGWADPRAPAAFARYAQRVAGALGDLVRYWITVNEPNLYTHYGFVLGWWPPERRNPLLALRAVRNLMTAHQQAAAALRATAPGAQVGATVNEVLYEGAAGPLSIPDRLLGAAARSVLNDLGHAAITRHSDWIGLNYYVRIAFQHGRPSTRFQRSPRNDTGHDLVPGGLYPLLRRVARFRKPIYVTEFGLADCRDRYRTWYVAASLAAIARAAADGADVRGAFYWSLLDNLEWDKGYWPRYGVVEVDRDTLQRRPRPSAYQIRDLVAAMRSDPAPDVDTAGGR